MKITYNKKVGDIIKLVGTRETKKLLIMQDISNSTAEKLVAGTYETKSFGPLVSKGIECALKKAKRMVK